MVDHDQPWIRQACYGYNQVYVMDTVIKKSGPMFDTKKQTLTVKNKF